MDINKLTRGMIIRVKYLPSDTSPEDILDNAFFLGQEQREVHLRTLLRRDEEQVKRNEVKRNKERQNLQAILKQDIERRKQNDSTRTKN